MEEIKTLANSYIEELNQNGIKAEETTNSIDIKNVYGQTIIRLSKKNLELTNYTLTKDEIYAFNVLYAIDLQEVSYMEDIRCNDNLKRFPQLDMAYAVISIQLDTERERLIDMVFRMYDQQNWPTLKPMLEKIIKTTKKNSIIYKDLYKTFNEKIKILSVVNL